MHQPVVGRTSQPAGRDACRPINHPERSALFPARRSALAAPRSACALAIGLLVVALGLGCETPQRAPTEDEMVQKVNEIYRAYAAGDCGTVQSRTRPEGMDARGSEVQHSLVLLHAFCMELAGDADGARTVYTRIVNVAPLSFASRDARERLRILTLLERDPEYGDWVAAARERAAESIASREPLDRGAAEFPPVAQAVGIEGYAVVEFGVTPDGRTDTPLVVDAKPPLLFDGAALRAVREWQYTRDPNAEDTERQVIRLVFRPDPDADLPMNGSAGAPGATTP